MSFEAEINFSFKLLSLWNASNDSVIFSPASILNGLSMIFAGTNGKAAKEIAEIIGQDKNDFDILTYYSEMLKRYQKNEDNNIKVIFVDRLFISDTVKLVPEFRQLMDKLFDGNVQEMNFNEAEKTSNEIKNYVNEKTNNQIKHITKPSDITHDLAVILINAIHFSAKWKDIFRSPTTKFTFYSNPPREIDAMYRYVMIECEWNYVQTDECDVLGIPYENNEAWMYIVLPKERNGLVELINNLCPEKFHQWTKRTPNRYTFVEIPIIKISNDFELKEKLQSLGIKAAFDQDCCDFTNKMTEKPSRLQKIIHKAVISVDEYGTEASASTAEYQLLCGGMGNFKADHPFLYFITTNNNSSKEEENDLKPFNILFMGTFC